MENQPSVNIQSQIINVIEITVPNEIDISYDSQGSTINLESEEMMSSDDDDALIINTC